MSETLTKKIQIAAIAASALFLKNGILRPMYDAVCADGQRLVFKPPHPDKDIGVAMVRALFELRNVVEYIFIDEAWMVASTDEAVMAETVRTGAAESPHRIEVLMFMAEDRDGVQLAWSRIERHPRLALSPLKFDSRSGSFHGRMFGLLPRPQTATVQ